MLLPQLFHISAVTYKINEGTVAKSEKYKIHEAYIIVNAQICLVKNPRRENARYYQFISIVPQRT
jgi:hypothetical protein